MKKIVIASTKVVATLILTVLVSGRIHAQPNPGPGNADYNGTYTTTTDGPTVPFDGGMSLMLAASGIGYASKKLKKNK